MTTRPIYLNRALYSLLVDPVAAAACIPRERYEVVMAEENIESIDFAPEVMCLNLLHATNHSKIRHCQ